MVEHTSWNDRPCRCRVGAIAAPRRADSALPAAGKPRFPLIACGNGSFPHTAPQMTRETLPAKAGGAPPSSSLPRHRPDCEQVPDGQLGRLHRAGPSFLAVV